LYAGQPLFDYIDASRKRLQTLAAGRTPEPKPPEDALNPAPAAAPATPVKAAADAVKGEDAGWHIPFYAASGKVIVAPKGNPWTDIPVFPFRNARDRKGKPVPF